MTTDPAPNISIEWLLASIAILMTTIRLYVRWRLQSTGLAITKSLLSDIATLLATLCLILTVSCDTLLFANGFFNPLIQNFSTNSSPENLLTTVATRKLVGSLKALYVSTVTIYTGWWAVKTAILLMYSRFVPVDTRELRNLRRGLYVIKLYTFTTGIVIVALAITSCSPIRRNWALERSELCMTCSQPVTFIFGLTAHLSTDILIFSFPFFLLLRHDIIRLSLQDKAGVAGMFCLGFLCILCTVIRQALSGTSANMSSTKVWLAADLSCGICVACAPSLKWLVMSMQYERGGSTGSVVENYNRRGGVEEAEVEVEVAMESIKIKKELGATADSARRGD